MSGNKRDNEITIKVDRDDEHKLMTLCVDLYLEAHPEYRDVPITRKFMINKVVQFYIDND